MGQITHRHHIIPKYMGGSNDPTNLVEVTITQHAMFHYCNWRLWSNEEDKIAWRALSGMMAKEEIIHQHLSISGKKGGKISYELGLGIHGLSQEEKIENAKKAGNKVKDLGLGIHSFTKEQRSENAKRAGNKVKDLGLGVHKRTIEQMSIDGTKGGNKSKEHNLGIHSLTKEQRSQNGKKAKKMGVGIFALTEEQRREINRKTNSQKWMCLETGYITNAGALSTYQNKRGIDTTKRIRIE